MLAAAACAFVKIFHVNSWIGAQPGAVERIDRHLILLRFDPSIDDAELISDWVALAKFCIRVTTPRFFASV